MVLSGMTWVERETWVGRLRPDTSLRALPTGSVAPTGRVRSAACGLENERPWKIRAHSSAKPQAALLQLFRRLLVVQELVGGDHRDAVPRADLVAQRAADAARQVDRADLEALLVARARDEVDAVDRADGHARLAAGAHVFVEQGGCGTGYCGAWRVDPLKAELGPSEWDRDVADWIRRASRGVGVVGQPIRETREANAPETRFNLGSIDKLIARSGRLRADEALIKLDLPRERRATDLVVQTMLGSAKMLRDEHMHPVELREMVTSPGGTTIRAIRVLEQSGVRAAFLNAIQAAMERSQELAHGEPDV